MIKCYIYSKDFSKNGGTAMAWVEYERGRVKHIINTLKRLLKQLPDYETYHIEAEMGIEGEKFLDGIS